MPLCCHLLGHVTKQSEDDGEAETSHAAAAAASIDSRAMILTPMVTGNLYSCPGGALYSTLKQGLGIFFKNNNIVPMFFKILLRFYLFFWPVFVSNNSFLYEQTSVIFMRRRLIPAYKDI
jgi:hypothetical protein